MKGKITLVALGIGIGLVALLFYFFYLESPSRKVLAHVNDEEITLSHFNEEVGKLESPIREMCQEDPNRLLEQMVMKRLLVQEAKKQGITPPPRTYKDEAKGKLSPEDVLVEELIKKKFPTPPEVTRDEVKTYYHLLKDKMGGRPMEQMAPMLEEAIREGKQQEQIGQFMKELLRNAKVEINQILLKKIAAKPPESNTEEDLKKALASGKPILVDFGANSCIPCRQLRPILKEISIEYREKAKILVIDIYQYQHLAREYKIVVLPTLVFFDSKGKEVFRQVGMMDKERIIAKLKEIGMES